MIYDSIIYSYSIDTATYNGSIVAGAVAAMKDEGSADYRDSVELKLIISFPHFF